MPGSKERLFVPDALEKLLRKSSARTWLICGVQHTAARAEAAPGLGASADSTGDIPTDRDVTHTTARASRGSWEKQSWRDVSCPSALPLGTSNALAQALQHQTRPLLSFCSHRGKRAEHTAMPGLLPSSGTLASYQKNLTWGRQIQCVCTKRYKYLHMCVCNMLPVCLESS